jgi:hypothetical protein
LPRGCRTRAGWGGPFSHALYQLLLITRAVAGFTRPRSKTAVSCGPTRGAIASAWRAS